MARCIPVMLATAFVVIQGTVSAQVVFGAATPPGVRFGPPVLKSAEPAPPPPQSPPPPHHHHGGHDHGPAVADGEDLFRARPDTYRPRPHPPLSVRRADFYPDSYPTYVMREVVVHPVVVERPVIVERKVERAAAGPPALAPDPSPVIKAPRKTIYVIPRCYAGDKPPDVSRLPAGCDIRDMRVLP